MNPQLEQFVVLMRRFPYCVACVVLTLALAGGAWWLWDDIDELETAHEATAKEGEGMLTLLVGGSTQRSELAAVRDIAHRIDDNLLVETSLVENNEYFYKFEARTGTHLVELHQMNSPITDTSALYRRIPYTLRVTGAYEQVATFLLDLETGPRLVNITGFSFSRQAASSNTRGGSGRDAPAETGASNVSLDLSLEMLGKK